jgi:hypothetical protein
MASNPMHGIPTLSDWITKVVRDYWHVTGTFDRLILLFCPFHQVHEHEPTRKSKHMGTIFVKMTHQTLAPQLTTMGWHHFLTTTMTITIPWDNYNM